MCPGPEGGENERRSFFRSCKEVKNRAENSREGEVRTREGLGPEDEEPRMLSLAEGTLTI